MFTIRNVGGIALLLAGSTWLWLTPAFASRAVSTSGVLWTVTRVLCLLTITGFLVATWGPFSRHSWWGPAALASAALGLIAVLLYVLAATRAGEPTGTWAWNTFVHVVMVLGVFVLLVVPQVERWVDRHVMGG